MNEDEENLDISPDSIGSDSDDSFDDDRFDGNSFDDDSLEEENPANQDDSEDDMDEQSASHIDDSGTPDINTLHTTEASGKVTKKENKAPFLARQLIVLAVLGGIIFVIFLVVFIIPLFSSDKTEHDELDKRGVVYIPDQVEKWKPETVLGNLTESFPEQTAQVPEVIKTDDEILAGLPFSDEAMGLAPVHPSNNVVPTSTATVSSRPETNRNEQQKMVTRMPMTDNGLNLNTAAQGSGGVFDQLMGSSPYGSAESYAQSATDRMNNLLSSVSNFSQGTSGTQGTNTYDSQNNQGNKQAFSNANSGQVGMQMNSEYSLYSGTIIPAALVTAINTDLPGVVIARVTSNVYSSFDGRHLLIPAGTRLFATYNSSISYGQNRIQVAWNKMIRPDGVEITLGNMTGVDAQGVSGHKGFVNNHPFEYAKAIGLIGMYSLVDAKMENIIGSQDNTYVQNILSDTYSSVSKLGGKIIDRALDIQPTITIAQGKEINIITNVTMDLPPVENIEVTERYIRQ